MDIDILETYSGLELLHYTVMSGNRVERVSRYSTNKLTKSTSHICVGRYNQDPSSEIQRKTELYKPKFGDKIFISSKCKLPRDLARKAYTITLSKDKADFIVVPRITGMSRVDANIIIKSLSTNKVYLISYRDNRVGDNLGDSARHLIIDDIYDNGDMVLMSSDVMRSVWFVPNVEEYIEILKGSDNMYVSDNMLPLKPDNKISVQTLDIWRRLANSDFNMFEKSLINSDAGNYPFTTWMFLKNEGIFWDYGNQTKWFLKSIGIDTPRNMDMWQWRNRIISVEDWKMLSDWIMFRLGVDSNGGFCDIDGSMSGYRKFFRTKLAVAPIKADNPVSLTDLGIC